MKEIENINNINASLNVSEKHRTVYEYEQVRKMIKIVYPNYQFPEYRYDIHHLIPSSRYGDFKITRQMDMKNNKVYIPVHQHGLYHSLFSNYIAEEVIYAISQKIYSINSHDRALLYLLSPSGIDPDSLIHTLQTKWSIRAVDSGLYSHTLSRLEQKYGSMIRRIL